MKKSICTSAFLALAFIGVGMASAEAENNAQPVVHHDDAAASAGQPAADHDSDGLSRDGEDCNKGCVDETN